MILCILRSVETAMWFDSDESVVFELGNFGRWLKQGSYLSKGSVCLAFWQEWDLKA